jgi:hypothetical protein
MLRSFTLAHSWIKSSHKACFIVVLSASCTWMAVLWTWWMWKHNTQKILANSVLWSLVVSPAIPWLTGSSSSLPLPSTMRVQYHTLLVWEKIHILHVVSAGCMPLLYHHKIEKLLSQTTISLGLSVLYVFLQLFFFKS